MNINVDTSPLLPALIDQQNELDYILDVLTGKLDLCAFNSDWKCFARYCAMQANSARRLGFTEIADIMQASGNRAARKARKVPK